MRKYALIERSGIAEEAIRKVAAELELIDAIASEAGDRRRCSSPGKESKERYVGKSV